MPRPKKPIQNEDVWDDSELMNAYQTAIDSYWQKHHNPSLAVRNTVASVSNATVDNEDDEEEGELPQKTEEADGKSDDNHNPTSNDNIEHGSRSSVKPKRKRSKKSKEVTKSSWDGPMRVTSATNAVVDYSKSQNGTAATEIHPAEHFDAGDSSYDDDDDDDSHDIERQQAWLAYYESQQVPGWYKWPSPQPLGTMFAQGGFNFGMPNPFAPTLGMSFPGFGVFGQSPVTMDANMISLLWSAYQAGYAAGANAAVGSQPVSNSSQAGTTPKSAKKKRKME